MIKEDLTGNKYGMLTVIKEVERSKHGRQWLCKCDCGNEKIVLGGNLKKNNTKSCGCLRYSKPNARKDLTGQKFGRLLVLGEPYTGERGTYWKCLCDCGNIVNKPAKDLSHGNVRSCGCLKADLHSTMNDLTGQKFGKLTALKTEKVGNDGQRIWLCLCDCGNYTEVLAGNLRKRTTQSCGCINSKGNLEIKNFLIKNNIPFKTEYTFKDCLSQSGNPLRFDFCIYKEEEGGINFLIEYDGNIHFEYGRGWNTKESFEERLQRDKIKTDYCLTNNIKLVRINYKENLQQRLEEIFNEL